MQVNYSSFPHRLCKAFNTYAALRRGDFLSILQIHNVQCFPPNSACIYAWYRLGCYQNVVDLAKNYHPKSARDITAISVSLAATGDFKQCQRIIDEHLSKVRQDVRFAIEAAQGVAKFHPSLAHKLVENLPYTADIRTACLYALGQSEQARKTFLQNKHPTRKDVVAGHFFLKANLSEAVTEKVAAINQQLFEFNLSEIQAPNTASSFRLDILRNADGLSLISGPLASIIVPAFNAAAYLEKSVSTLLEQTYSNLEVIIVNDGSSDNTQHIARTLSNRDSRVRLLEFTTNRGAYAARNAGLKEAHGHFVTVHDADDFAHAQKIEKQVFPLLQDDRLVFSISDMVRVSSDGTFARREIYPLQRMNTSSLLFRRELVLRECGYWEEKRFGADSEYLFRLRNSFAKNRWVRLRLPLSFAADHSASLTASISTGGLGQPSDPRRIAYTEAYTHRWLQRLCSQSYD